MLDRSVRLISRECAVGGKDFSESGGDIFHVATFGEEEGLRQPDGIEADLLADWEVEFRVVRRGMGPTSQALTV